MRWGSKTTQCIRPIHTVTMLYGTDLIQGKVLDVNSARLINGHRFHSDAPFELDSADNYLSKLEQHYVIADHNFRKAKILAQIQRLAIQENAVADINDELLEEVTSLVEWPVALVANFDETFFNEFSHVMIAYVKLLSATACRYIICCHKYSSQVIHRYSDGKLYFDSHVIENLSNEFDFFCCF